jgi:DNA mismatch endonuclease (patch repair protein)
LKVCIFLDSDFWHGWQYPRWKHLLKSDFWRQKIERNRERDRQVSRKLRQQKWRVVRVWEHNLRKNLEGTVIGIVESLKTQRRMEP